MGLLLGCFGWERSVAPYKKKTELSLHPEVVRFIPQMFSSYPTPLQGGEILISTHSPHLLRDEGIGLDKAFLHTTSRQWGICSHRERV